MSLSACSGARIALFATAWIVGLPFVLFLVLQVWVILVAHAEAGATVSSVHVSLLPVFVVLLGPPVLLVATWALARRLARGA